MINATFPACPINDCEGTFTTKTSAKGRHYRQCDTCGAFDGARFLTPAERAQQKREKAAKRGKKAKAKEPRPEVKQLPVEGWSINEWFPEEEQCRLQTQLHLNI